MGRYNIRPMRNLLEVEWFRKHLPVLMCRDSRGIVALKDGVPVAGCIMDNWCANSVQIHHVLLDPFVLRNGWIETLRDAAVGNDDRQVVFSMVPESNEKSLRFHKKLGFKETGRVPNGEASGVDYVVISALADEFSYGRKDHG